MSNFTFGNNSGSTQTSGFATFNQQGNFFGNTNQNNTIQGFQQTQQFTNDTMTQNNRQMFQNQNNQIVKKPQNDYDLF
jgi:hypothetical protein